MKRALFLALLLANMGLFAWYRWYLLPSEASPALAPALSGAPLKLSSELSASERKALATASAAAAPATAPAPATSPVPAASTAAGLATAANSGAEGCATYGPFSGTDVLQQAETRLKQLGLETVEHTVPGKTKPGYWVYLPPFGSVKEANAAADLLKNRGVGDIYVVTDEANRNAISLGLFKQHEGAIARVKELKKLGYHPQMTERFRDEPHYWVDARGAGNSLPPADLFKDLGGEDSPVGRGTGVCAAPSG